MNRQFTFPAVVAASVHAVLFLGFSPPPRPVPEKPREEKFVDLGPIPPPQEEEPALTLADAAAAEAGGKNTPAPPSAADARPNAVDLNAIPIAWKPKRAEIGKPNAREIGSPHGPGEGEPGIGRIGVPSILRAGDLDNPPRTKAQASPLYPHHLRTAGITGEVVVDFIVDEGGRVFDAVVVRSTQSEFEEPALRAVRTWRFEPGRRHGKPVKFRMSVPLIFSLTE